MSEVLVHTKTEPMPCPVANELRPPSEIESDTRATVRAHWRLDMMDDLAYL